MSQEFELVDSGCYQNIVGLGRPLVGYDSDVYVNGEEVVKVYCHSRSEQGRPVPDEAVFLYWNITNAVCSLSAQEEQFLELQYSKQKISVKFNPISRIYKCKSCGFVESRSPTIVGDNLKVSSREYDPEELQIGLTKLGYSLEDRLGVHGINLIPINVKRFESGLIVTDICSDISSLRIST